MSPSPAAGGLGHEQGAARPPGRALGRRLQDNLALVVVRVQHLDQTTAFRLALKDEKKRAHLLEFSNFPFKKMLQKLILNNIVFLANINTRKLITSIYDSCMNTLNIQWGYKRLLSLGG